MILKDSQIRELAQKGMISPFESKQMRTIVHQNHVDSRLFSAISYGTSSAGYDMRLGYELRFVKPDITIDPKNPNPANFSDPIQWQWDGTGSFYWLSPGAFALGVSMEEYVIPDNVIGLVFGKSTYARSGINVLVTPLEPGWKGQVTIEIKNETPAYVKLYAAEGIGQIVFCQIDGVPDTTYADKESKYQGQTGITFGRV